MGGFSTLALAAIALMLALHSASADYPAPTYSVSLDAAADTRWDAAIRGQVKTHGWDGTFGAVEDYMNSWIEPSLAKILAPLLDGLLKDMPGDYGNEVTGVWNSINAIKPASSNLTLGHIIAMNLIYEFSCTSIVAQDSVGNVFHGRNLDYPIPGLSNITARIDFTKGGKLQYHGTAFVGYVGLLTGMAPGKLSISIDERTKTDAPYYIELLENLISASEGGRSVGFLIRDTLANQTSFEDALLMLNTTRVIGPSYLIVGGVGEGEGAIITRNRDHADDSGPNGAEDGVWRLNAPQDWWRCETNYDHWKAPPSGDDRRDPCNKMMGALGQDGVTPDAMFKVLSTPPVNNDGTKYTTIMSAAKNVYDVTVREH